MIIFDRDGFSETTVYGEGLFSQTPTQKQSVLPKPVLDFQQQIQEPINKNIIDIIKKIRERLSNPSSSISQQGLKTSSMSQTGLPGLKAGFENI